MSELVSIQEFEKFDLRIGVVTAVEPHPNADKLLVMKVDLGEPAARQLVAGLKPYYKPEELVGMKVVVITNLASAKLRGVESQGMLLAAVAENQVVCLRPEKDIPVGSRVR